jgi:hypothetical protein
VKTKTIILQLVGISFVCAATSAQAIPAFARKYSTNCTACHTSFPALNSRGRQFKEAGYRFPKLKGEKTISDFLHWDKYLPVSAMVKARPYDKKDSGDEKTRAIHEVEILVGGVFYKNVSGFFELEAEDEDTNARGFEVGIPHATLTYSHSKALNASVSWAQLLADDPYDTYSDGRRLTRGHFSVIDQKFGNADAGGNLRDSRQTVSIHGRPVDPLYYSIGISGVADDSEGVNPGTVHGRLAWDITPDVMVGLLAVDGTCEAGASGCAVDRDYTRFGIDAQADIGNFRVQGVYMKAEDDNATSTATDENDAWYVQGQYTMMDKGRPTFVPLVRFDNYEKNDGQDEYREFTLNLGYYFTQNIKGYLEYWDRYDTPTGVAEDDRVTVQFDAAF